ncbi:MAG: hypothetical protein ACRD2S_03220 [Terriglobales bacterium]
MNRNDEGRKDRVDRPFASVKFKDLAVLLLLAAGAFLVHGYHPGVEDAEIYLPGIEKLLHPELFPFNAEFFNSHASLTLFPNLIAAFVRTSHLSLSMVLLWCEAGSIFLLLLACWQLSGELFENQQARWCGAGLVTALLTMPVAGTALYIIDQYTNPRNLAAFAAIFAAVGVLKKKYLATGLWLIFAAAVHPLMAVFALSFCVLLLWMNNSSKVIAAAAALSLPLEFSFQKPSAAYHEATLYHPFHYILNWQWYEWLGIVAPVALFWWFARMARSRHQRNLELVCRALIIYDLVYFAGALMVSIPARFESLARLQPLRSLHLLYILLLVTGGGLLGEYVLRRRLWRWALLFLPLSVGMFMAQRQLFPASPHIEWTLDSQKNDWARAFVWIRQNTSTDARFALDPQHMAILGEDGHGFRAIAERSMLADAMKDSGAVTMFPPLAEEWSSQVRAQSGWKHFQLRDFRRLQKEYGVNWVVVQTPGAAGLNCPYENASVKVCRLG